MRLNWNQSHGPWKPNCWKFLSGMNSIEMLHQHFLLAFTNSMWGCATYVSVKNKSVKQEHVLAPAWSKRTLLQTCCDGLGWFLNDEQLWDFLNTRQKTSSSLYPMKPVFVSAWNKLNLIQTWFIDSLLCIFFWLFCCTILIFCFVHSDFGSRAWLQTASCVPPMKVHHALSVCPRQQIYCFSRLYQHNWRDVLLCEQQDKVIVRLCCWSAAFSNKLLHRMSSSPAAQSRGSLVVGVVGKMITHLIFDTKFSFESQMQVKA